MSDTTVTGETTATDQAEPANAATPDLLDWAVIVDEPLPPAIRGLDGPTMTLANVAATDGKARVSPLDKEDTLRAMSRYLDNRGLRVKYQLHGNGSALIWQVVPKATRTITDEHRAKMAAAAEKRKAANAAARAKLLAQAKKLGIPSPDELPTKQLRERVEKAGS